MKNNAVFKKWRPSEIVMASHVKGVYGVRDTTDQNNFHSEKAEDAIIYIQKYIHRNSYNYGSFFVGPLYTLWLHLVINHYPKNSSCISRQCFSFDTKCGGCILCVWPYNLYLNWVLWHRMPMYNTLASMWNIYMEYYLFWVKTHNYSKVSWHKPEDFTIDVLTYLELNSNVFDLLQKCIIMCLISVY